MANYLGTNATYIPTTGNPKRSNKGRYCKGVVAADGKSIAEQGKILKSAGHAPTLPTKNEISSLKKGNFAKGSELTDLRKEAKALGIERVNSFELEPLRVEIAKVKKAKPAEKPEKAEKATGAPEPPEEPAVDEKTRKKQLKAEIVAKGGTAPKGNPGIPKLEAALRELG